MQLPKYTYLYGYTPEQIQALAHTPYKQALDHKIQAAKDLKKRLLVGTYIESDTDRINAIEKAIKFNQELLKELE